MVRLEITADLARISTTQAIVKALPQLAEQNMKKMLRNGDVRLNGTLIKKDYELAEGDVIEVYLPDHMRGRPQLDICYEDRNILVAQKKPGVTVQSAGSGKDLLSLVRNYMLSEGEYLEEAGYVPLAVENLDVNTGGLTMFAKNAETYDFLWSARRERRIRHVFQALVHGTPAYDAGELQHFYAGDAHRERVSKDRLPGGVPIYTRYRVLKSSGPYSLLEIEPVTAVPNQERIHLLAAGYPIVGDPVYGDPKLNKKTGVRYQALWSTEIGFVTGTSNHLGYLNGRSIRTDDIVFPLVSLVEAK